MRRQRLIDARGSQSQINISTALGISQKYLSKIELGQRTPSAALLAKISHYYKQPVEFLFPDIFLNENTPKCCKNKIQVS